MPIRKELLAVGEVYHVFSKSIAGFDIFNSEHDLERMLLTLRYYRQARPSIKLSKYLQSQMCLPSMQNDRLVDIIAFCIMPTHVHCALKQLTEGGISIYMGNVLNSYARYFNIKYKRKGPLYEGRFKSVLVESNEQLYHLTRYIHLNPVAAGLTDKPEEWRTSSYNEYTSCIEESEKICSYNELLNITPNSYKEFVMMRKDYQKELSRIKGLIID